ncbi:IS4 family transposase, partial [Neisseria macacae ATCC 33926]
KDKDARWTKKNGLYKLGYKQHTRTDEEGYIEKLHITPANTHECNHLSPLLEGIAEGTTVYADKGYDSAENRQHLKEHQLLDGIMRKACRNRPLTEAQTKQSVTDICRRPVMWSNKALVRCTVNFAMPGQPISD